MARLLGTEIDKIGPWSEIKLEIINKYAKAYAKILSKRKYFKPVYIDAFAGAGIHQAKGAPRLIAGSPTRALKVKGFVEYHFIDLAGDKLDLLSKLVGERDDAHLYKGDCNDILLETIFPTMERSSYRKGLCLLDPYGLHLDWEVLAEAARLETIEIFLNFPIKDINLNALKKDPKTVAAGHAARMTRYWGDESWKDLAFKLAAQPSLFEKEPALEKAISNDAVAAAFRDRLQKIAGFPYVPEPIPMHYGNVVLYYLFFAGPNEVGPKIATDIFNKYRGASRG